MGNKPNEDYIIDWWIEEGPWSKPEDIKQKFINNFYKSSLAWRNKNTFIDEIMDNESISDSKILQRELKSFKAYSDDSDFTNFDESKISIFDLKRAVWREATKLWNTRNNYLENTFKLYDLDDKQKKILEKKIKNTKEHDLIQMTSSSLANSKFLGKTFWINKIAKIDNFKVFNNLSTEEVTQRLWNIWEWERYDVEYALTSFKNGQLTDIDLKTLFSSNFLKDSEKKELLSNYIPFISLQKALDLGILSQKEAESQKNKVLKPLIKSNGISGDQLEQSLKSASLNDVEVKSSDFFRDDKNLNIIAEGVWFRHIEAEFKSTVENSRNDIDANGPQNLEQLKALLSG